MARTSSSSTASPSGRLASASAIVFLRPYSARLSARVGRSSPILRRCPTRTGVAIPSRPTAASSYAGAALSMNARSAWPRRPISWSAGYASTRPARPRCPASSRPARPRAGCTGPIAWAATRSPRPSSSAPGPGWPPPPGPANAAIPGSETSKHDLPVLSPSPLAAPPRLRPPNCWLGCAGSCGKTSASSATGPASREAATLSPR